MTIEHAELYGDAVHSIIAGEWADDAERTAYAPSGVDLGRVFRQVDTGALHAVVKAGGTYGVMRIASHADVAANAAAIDTKADRLFALNAQTGSTYTTVLADAGKLITAASATGTLVTIPPNASVAYAVGSVLTLTQLGLGQLTLAAGAGVTLRTASSLKTRAQYSVLSATKIAADEWLVSGDLASV